MRKIKAKRGAFWQTQMLPFVIVWTLGIGVIGIISRLWQSIPLSFLYNEPEIRVALMLLTSAISTGLLQVFLVERLLRKPMRDWLLYTVASALIALFLDAPIRTFFFLMFQFWDISYEVTWILGTLAVSAPTLLIQAFWLQKRVKHAWLWPILTIPLLIAFIKIPFSGANYQLLKMSMLLSVGVVQAGLMHYFWQHPKDTEKAKIDFDTDDQSDDDRRERLQERDTSNPLWDVGDDQILQSEA